MTDASDNPIASTGRGQKDWTLYSLQREAELEKLDRQAGREYLPMDVFVDPETMKAHFQDSSICARRASIHPAAASRRPPPRTERSRRTKAISVNKHTV